MGTGASAQRAGGRNENSMMSLGSIRSPRGGGGYQSNTNFSQYGTYTSKKASAPQLANGTYANFRGLGPELMKSIERTPGVVDHFIPATFPLEALLDPIMIAKCRYTWGLIMAGTADGMKNHVGKAGIVLYHDEFFFRLFKRAKVFIDIFSDPAKRGEVLMKAMGFILTIEGDDSPREAKRLFYLGKSHQFKHVVRPWHFSVYMETALETMMFWLGSHADVEAGEAWTCLVAYVMKRMLQAYLVDRVVPNEFYQNYEIDSVRKILTQSVHSKLSEGAIRSQASEADSQMRSQGADDILAEGDEDEESAANSGNSQSDGKRRTKDDEDDGQRTAEPSPRSGRMSPDGPSGREASSRRTADSGMDESGRTGDSRDDADEDAELSAYNTNNNSGYTNGNSSYTKGNSGYTRGSSAHTHGGDDDDDGGDGGADHHGEERTHTQDSPPNDVASSSTAAAPPSSSSAVTPAAAAVTAAGPNTRTPGQPPLAPSLSVKQMLSPDRADPLQKEGRNNILGSLPPITRLSNTSSSFADAPTEVQQ